MIKKLILLICIVLIIFYFWNNRSVSHPPGILVKKDPIQELIQNPEPISYKGCTITPLATFKAKARVLSKKKYSFGRESDLAPIDLALGWGQMSNSMVLKEISIRQTSRFYFWRSSSIPPIPEKQIKESSANMHFIPSTDAIMKELITLKKGSIISFSGYLVNVTAPDGWQWNSSLTRKDTGNGACELIWLKKLSVVEMKKK